MNITYLGPVFYDEQIFVETLLKEIGPLKLKFGFRVYNSDRRLINKGDLTFIFVDRKTRKPRRSMDIVNIINKQIYHEVQQ
jgi:acyl-CoA thioesterase FadM